MRQEQRKRWGGLSCRLLCRVLSIACLAMVPLLVTDCVKHQHFRYALAEATLGNWQADAWLGSTPTGRLHGSLFEPTRIWGSPYELTMSLNGVPPSAIVMFEKVVLTSVADGSAFPVVLGPVSVDKEGAWAWNRSVVLPYEDYVLTARVTVKIDSVVAEETVRLTLVRAYSEERKGLLSDLIMGF